MTYTLREANLDDLEAIMQIEDCSFHKGIREDESVFRKRVTTFPKGFILLVDEQGVPKGYFASEIWQLDEKASEINASLFALNHDIGDHHTDDGNTLYVSSIAILPECRGYGLGDLFFTQAISRIKAAFPNLTQSILIVNESWVRARAIYRKWGYEEKGAIPLFFRPEGDAPQSAIIMAGPLV